MITVRGEAARKIMEDLNNPKVNQDVIRRCREMAEVLNKCRRFGDFIEITPIRDYFTGEKIVLNGITKFAERIDRIMQVLQIDGETVIYALKNYTNEECAIVVKEEYEEVMRGLR